MGSVDPLGHTCSSFDDACPMFLGRKHREWSPCTRSVLMCLLSLLQLFEEHSHGKCSVLDCLPAPILLEQEYFRSGVCPLAQVERNTLSYS